jgi:hypothetical protein
MFRPPSRRPKIVCPSHSPAILDLSLQRVEKMPQADLFDWTANVAYDVNALVDMVRRGDEDALGDLRNAEVMLHACIVEIIRRTPH